MTLILNGTDNSATVPAVQGGTAGTSTGLYYPTTSAVGISTAGTNAVYIDASQNVGIGTSSPATKLHIKGSLALGSIRSESTGDVTTTGYNYISFYDTSGQVGYLGYAGAANSYDIVNNLASGFLTFKTGGYTERMRIDSSGNVGIGTNAPSVKLDVVGTISTSAIYTSNRANAASYTSGSSLELKIDGTTYAAIRQPAAEVLAFYRGNGGTNETMRIDSSGAVLIGNTTEPGRFTVKTADTSSGTWGCRMVNSAGTIMFAFLNNGNFYTGGGAGSPYSNTTAAAANVVVTSDSGLLLRSTSSIKYKTDVQGITHGLTEVLALRPVTYKGKNDGDTIFGGLIAEEVHEAGLTEFVQYAEDGSPDSLSYGNMVSLAFKAIQEQQTLITSLTARITALEAA